MMNKSAQNPVKVCFVMPKAYPLFNPTVEAVFGGSEVDLYYLATELAKDENFHVTFIVADYGQPKYETAQGVHLIKSLSLEQNSLLGARCIWKALRKADAHIYLTKTISPGAPLVAWFCSHRRRAFTYRTANQHECDGVYVKAKPLLGRAFTWSLRQAQTIFTQNVTDWNNLQKSLGLSSKVIPNGHPLPTPKLIEDRRDTILWAGRSATIKKPDLFIKLAREIPELKFTMICQEATGDTQYVSLKAQAEKIDNLKFIPRVPFPEIDSFFQRAKVLVNTSDSEGFPNTFIQAAKWAVPILSLNVNPDGFLDRYRCGLYASGDWDQFTKMLAQLSDPATAQSFRRHARIYAEENHDLKKIIESYKSIFRNLAKNP